MDGVNILIVEDDLIAGAYLEKICTEKGFIICDSCDNGKEALDACKRHKPTVILMDIMIKGSMSGCDLAMQIRAFNTEVIIIFITAYTSDEMIDYALDTNAYSYLLKPYRDVEILSTIQMSLHDKKLSLGNEKKNQYIFCKHGFKYDIENHKFYGGKHEIPLSKKLLLLVALLSKHKGTSVSYEQINHALWGEMQNINTLRAVVHRLKHKIPELEVHTVSKGGYVLY
ncbi:Two-component hybrid sensor and regulator [hydrothermal vent metagenome]|uniref:Two-component hybrid sensor and regulator n=1 Tax=hydrothermal vent metagenome TaxID=652676 RepID=A0A1W1CTX7_9ZZZZ